MTKTYYGNWMPKWMIRLCQWTSFLSFALLCWVIYYFIGAEGGAYILGKILAAALLLSFIVSLYFARKFSYMRDLFDFSRRDSLSWQIIASVADAVDLPAKSRILDVGCGSGALSIEMAKRHPDSAVMGVDIWQAAYTEFSQKICEHNAQAEGVLNVFFQKDDARNLALASNHFDAVVSNYVYHNIPGDRGKYLLESLRVLKKGGSFAIHDIFNQNFYGDLEVLEARIRDAGISEVKFIDSCLTEEEAKSFFAKGSKILVGKK